MDSDSWMEEFFTISEDIDHLEGEGGIEMDGVGELIYKSASVDGVAEEQGEVSRQVDMDLPLMPWNCNMNFNHEYPDNTVDSHSNAEWLVATDPHDSQIQQIDDTFHQQLPWPNSTSMAMQIEDISTKQVMDTEFLQTIHSVENWRLFGDNATLSPYLPLPSGANFDKTSFDFEQPLPATVSFTTDMAVTSHQYGQFSQFTHFNMEAEIFGAPVITQFNQFDQNQGSIENPQTIIGDGPKKRKRRRLRENEYEFGNNHYGRTGVLRCQTCRNRNSKCVFSHPWKPCEFCESRQIQAPCRKVWGPRRQARFEPSRQLPMPDDSMVQPEDRLLYQYLFTEGFNKCFSGFLLQPILVSDAQRSGGFIRSAALRHTALWIAVLQLGFKTMERKHRGIVLREVSRRIDFRMREYDLSANAAIASLFRYRNLRAVPKREPDWGFLHRFPGNTKLLERVMDCSFILDVIIEFTAIMYVLYPELAKSPPEGEEGDVFSMMFTFAPLLLFLKSVGVKNSCPNVTFRRTICRRRLLLFEIISVEFGYWTLQSQIVEDIANNFGGLLQ